ncbi:MULTISPECIES: DNA integrity scanning diadenylate cyclase DisA [Romboutsia]|uniref:DNA integrity scanning protein DisA n=1 Tax=Romboutsia hominis TaxID=1507512 RepID=A0A2P2BVG4_9FIRM|nr:MULTISPECIES: DNA integrity scanning diadenylate cyclase DisA [Romboutsia]MCH1958835.1 DNA integrity scanning diadenylate cyclase DisA [Romboutsia hominis]MCH1970750.1 DNA integrity scanning diadenylate cyclase DisA [Romboutsia hominis]MDB8794460.1 DNA integrity scanning diadenylate cyclase DisA [Romboutsia sp. 1001216sp1]MDB8797410.1 DNA integrity scanning diadenylate cyclase DisA [Romboutsia sp. 1001216sp1]MDB8800287.1 DNA integrity scanning diadenylate cyclase DisA [Romboutsia sp. 100121
MEDILNNKNVLHALKMISPGSPLRQGLENVLKAKTGGLIVISNGEDTMKVVDGGFNINADYSPAYLYELAKMDGAIVLSQDVKKILFANAQLIPDYSIPTSETGTRHRTAERVARQTGSIVIAISQRRNVITVYRGDQKYALEEISKIFTKANQALQTLEKYKAVLDQAVASLNALEFNDLVTIYDVAIVLQKMEMVMRITSIIEKYIIELGQEGTLVRMQLEELVGTTKIDQKLILKDYSKEDIDIKLFKKKIKTLSPEELVDLTNMAKLLGYSGFSENMDMEIRPRGYRVLNKIHRLPSTIIENLVNYFEDFQEILDASIEDLDDVEGIGEIRATYIRNGLIKMKQLVLLDRLI